MSNCKFRKIEKKDYFLDEDVLYKFSHFFDNTCKIPCNCGVDNRLYIKTRTTGFASPVEAYVDILFFICFNVVIFCLVILICLLDNKMVHFIT